jgi:hypothetical protein
MRAAPRESDASVRASSKRTDSWNGAFEPRTSGPAQRHPLRPSRCSRQRQCRSRWRAATPGASSRAAQTCNSPSVAPFGQARRMRTRSRVATALDTRCTRISSVRACAPPGQGSASDRRQTARIRGNMPAAYKSRIAPR